MSTTPSAQSTTGTARSPLRAWVARRPLATFFALAFGLTWSFLIADALGQRGIIPFRLTLSGPGLALTLFVSYCPTIAALLVAWLTEGTAGLRSLLGGVVRWRVGLRWYVLALLGPAMLFFAASQLSALFGGEPHVLPPGGWTLLVSGLIGSIAHGIANGEEIGWRGYALPRLLQRYNALTASLVLGVIWAVFHVPIMFAPGSVFGSQSFDIALPFLVGTIALSTVITWLYRSTGGSVLLIILLHGAFNTWPSILGDGNGVGFLLQVLVAVVVVAVYGPAHLSRTAAAKAEAEADSAAG